MPDEVPQLHIDSDWKAQAQAEKDKLSAADTARQGAEGGQRGADGGLPDASFRTLASMLASQALMGLGTMADPEGRGIMIDLEGSRLSIDLLAVLEEKTKGNLTEEEKTELTQLLAELRARYVQITRLLAQQASGAAGRIAAGGPAATAGVRGPILPS